MTDGADHLFFDSAMQYYIAGRYAVFVWLNPVAANLLHHAVEMCLKGALSKGGKSLRELRGLNHDLPKIWDAFKMQAGDANLNKFDGVVSALHDFEELRYPDSVSKRGMLSGFIVRKATSVPLGSGPSRPEPKYDLCLEEIDEIFGAVFKAANINPKFFTNSLHEEAKQYLTRENVWMTD